jgi:Ca2+-binding RTX toxin-like protein
MADITGTEGPDTRSGTDLADSITGLGGADSLSGLGGADTLEGGDGADSLVGGLGNDRLMGGADADRIDSRDLAAGADTLEGNDGADTLFSPVIFNATIEPLVDGGTGDDLLGLAGDVTAIGGDGLDTFQLLYVSAYSGSVFPPGPMLITVLDFASGAGGDRVDTLPLLSGFPAFGGDNPFGSSGFLRLRQSGDDTFLDLDRDGGGDTWVPFVRLVSVVAADLVEENLGFAPDGSADETGIVITGTAANDSLPGSTGPDTIYGLAGQDTVVGGAGADSIEGGAGSDSLLGQDGDDTILGHEGTLAGSFADTLLGGAGNDSLRGADGAGDVLAGGAGDDTMEGGSGGFAGDIASFVGAPGPVVVDLVAQTASGDGDDVLIGIEGAIGTSGSDTLIGDDQANRLDGGSGGNDSLVGAGGNDSLYALYAGASTLSGGDGADVLSSSGGSDRLDGGAGNDMLSAAAGNDSLLGGSGDDIFIAGAGDDLFDGGDGTDLLQFLYAVPVFIDLSAGRATGDGNDTVLGVERVSGGQGGDTILGDALDNLLYGNAGNDLLQGAGGADNLYGGTGADTYDGGAGFDTVYFFADANPLHGIVASMRSGLVADDGFGNADSLAGGAANTIERLFGSFYGDDLTGKRIAEQGDFGESLVSMLLGGFGADTLSAEEEDARWVAADLSYYAQSTYGPGSISQPASLRVDLVAQRVYEAGVATDVLDHIGAAQGSVLGDTLLGDDQDNWLGGLNSNDSLDGAGGWDVASYKTSGRVAVDLLAGTAQDGLEAYKAVWDGYSWTAVRIDGSVGNDNLAGIEEVEGSAAGADTLLGDDGANILWGFGGNDLLDGRGGGDTLIGGPGDDLYRIDSTLDRIEEADGGGADTVIATFSWTAAPHVEAAILEGAGAMTLIGTVGADVLKANDGGSVLGAGRGMDSLQGGAGNDVLNGGIEGDTLAGGAGDDRYRVDHPDDTVIEAPDDGDDLVAAYVDWVLPDNVERLRLGGVEALSGTGNGLDNHLHGNDGANALRGLDGSDVLVGNAGADTLAGGAGPDLLVGGADADWLLFGDTSDGQDRIADFEAGLDVIAVSAAGFGIEVPAPGSLPVALPAAHFVARVGNGGTAAPGTPQFVYNTTTGLLFFDADGAGAIAPVRIAELVGLPALAASDFMLV